METNAQGVRISYDELARSHFPMLEMPEVVATEIEHFDEYRLMAPPDLH